MFLKESGRSMRNSDLRRETLTAYERTEGGFLIWIPPRVKYVYRSGKSQCCPPYPASACFCLVSFHALPLSLTIAHGSVNRWPLLALAGTLLGD